jgi:hypothetical protein
MDATMTDNDDRLREVEYTALATKTRMDAHETLCAQRYQGIIDTHLRLEAGQTTTNTRLLQVGWALILGLCSILVKLVFFTPHP